MADETNALAMQHSLNMESRERLTVTGVKDVESFDETVIVALTCCGELTVNGTQLHISSLNIDNGQLSVEGKISSLLYADRAEKSSGIFGKLFK